MTALTPPPSSLCSPCQIEHVQSEPWVRASRTPTRSETAHFRIETEVGHCRLLLIVGAPEHDLRLQRASRPRHFAARRLFDRYWHAVQREFHQVRPTGEGDGLEFGGGLLHRRLERGQVRWLLGGDPTTGLPGNVTNPRRRSNNGSSRQCHEAALRPVAFGLVGGDVSLRLSGSISANNAWNRRRYIPASRSRRHARQPASAACPLQRCALRSHRLSSFNAAVS